MHATTNSAQNSHLLIGSLQPLATEDTVALVGSLPGTMVQQELMAVRAFDPQVPGQVGLPALVAVSQPGDRDTQKREGDDAR